MLQTVRIAVLATAPIPGLAKTRLIPALDAQLGAVTVWCTPDSRHRFFRALPRTSGLELLMQSGGDFGDRMHTAFRLHCVQGPLLVVGTDCPVLRPRHLRETAQALIDGADATFYPAEDGGYALVGLREPQPALFADMPWSTSRVMSETRSRAHAHSLHVREFETLWDVDLPAQPKRLDAPLAKAAR